MTRQAPPNGTQTQSLPAGTPAHTPATDSARHGLIACHECDLLVRLPTLEQTHRLSCPRCKHSLGLTGERHLERALPLGICAALLLALSLMFPFLAFERAGVSNQMTLLQTGIALVQDGSLLLGALVLLFIILAPCLLVGCILLIACSLRLQRPLPGVKTAARLMHRLTSWNMVEVFIIGVFVSLVKIAGMAHVALGISLWSYLALAIVLTAAAGSLERISLWRRLAELEAPA
ncbi:paraquat-inducible protein A [Halopseudomonas sp.]|uniref:paraquat-inducible protein A n=1 Tax=Halopseudomonas sp. TaxID=2901191 RepID=UPI00311D2FEF